MNNAYFDKSGRYPIQKVGIEEVDSAVFDYFDKKLTPTIDSPDGARKVPIFFAAGERWALMRKNNFRDKHDALILPIISVRRTNIIRERGFGGMAQETKSITVSKMIHPKTGNIQNLIDSKKRRGLFHVKKQEPVMEIMTIPFPDFCQVLYEITIWCQFDQHMNEILEKIFYKYEHLDSFVMPLNYDGKAAKGDSYYFVGFREGTIDKKSNDDNFTDQEKIIQYSYNIKVPVYFILDPADETLAYGEGETGNKVVYKQQTTNQISIKETVMSIEEFEDLFG